MKIDHVEVVNLKYDYPDRHGFAYIGGVCTGRLTSIVTVTTDTGLVGVGSAYTHPLLCRMIVEHDLKPFLVGEDPLQIESLWAKMYGLTRWYGRKGAAMTAIGGIDTALWDIRGQVVGKPVWSLLGGTKNTCPAYASGLLWNTPEKLAQEAAGYIDRGFRRVKMRLAHEEEEEDRAAVTAVRKAIGFDNDLICDGSMHYSFSDAKRMGEFLGENKVFWFEEPFCPEDIDDYARLRGTVPVRIAAGENEFGLQGFRELIRAGAIDIAQPDVSRCGGISEAVKISRLAHGHNIPIATHTWSDAVAIIANAHVVSAMPNGLTVEIDQTGNPFIDQLLDEPLEVRDGQLKLSDKPGLGITLNPRIVERYRMTDPLSIDEGCYSDMAFGKSSFSPAASYTEVQ